MISVISDSSETKTQQRFQHSRDWENLLLRSEVATSQYHKIKVRQIRFLQENAMHYYKKVCLECMLGKSQHPMTSDDNNSTEGKPKQHLHFSYHSKIKNINKKSNLEKCNFIQSAVKLSHSNVLFCFLSERNGNTDVVILTKKHFK